MMLSHATMGVLALSVLWLTTLLIVWVSARDLARVARRLLLLRGRVHRVTASAVIARHVAEQVGRAQSVSLRQRAVFFRDRNYRSELLGNEVVLAGGERVRLEARDVEVWLERPEKNSQGGGEAGRSFADAYAQALRPRGLPVTLSREVKGAAWVAGERCGESLGALPDGSFIVASFDPRRFCARAIVLSLAVLSGIVAWSTLVTALVLTRPVFGTVSTIGGVLGLVEFLLIQPLGTWLRDRVLWPHEAPVETRWAEPLTAARENRSSPATAPR
jgi:hypothetical protein